MGLTCHTAIYSLHGSMTTCTTRYHSEHVINLYTLCHLCAEVVCVGSMCWNHPELVRIRSSDRMAVE